MLFGYVTFLNLIRPGRRLNLFVDAVGRRPLMEMKTGLIEKLLRQAAEAAEAGLAREAVALYRRVLKHSKYHLGACG